MNSSLIFCTVVVACSIAACSGSFGDVGGFIVCWQPRGHFPSLRRKEKASRTEKNRIGFVVSLQPGPPHIVRLKS